MFLTEQSEGHTGGQDPVRPSLKWAVIPHAYGPERSARIAPAKIPRLSWNSGNRQCKRIPDGVAALTVGETVEFSNRGGVHIGVG